MQLTSTVRIGRPAPEVLDVLLDAGKVAACLPGSRLIGEVDEGTYAGEIQLRIGPVDAVYAGTVHLDAADRSAGTARLRASGQERSGQGSADASVTLRVEPQGAGTRVLISTDLMIRGAVARYAVGAIGDVGQRLVEEFAGNVERLLAGQATLPASQPIPGQPIPGRQIAGQPGPGQPIPGGPGRGQPPGPGRDRPAARNRALAAGALLAAGTLAALLAAWAWRRAAHGPAPAVLPYLSPEGDRYG